MQQKSVQAENELWDAAGEALDMEMSTVEDVLESLARTQKGNVKSSIENCMTILYRDPVLKDAICKNELTNKIDIIKQLLWKRNGSCITDVDMYQIQRYIETNYGISSDKAINKAATIFQRHRLLTHITGTVLTYTALRSTTCRKQPQRQHLPTPLQMTGQRQKSISTRRIRRQEKPFRRETQNWRAQSMVCMPVTILHTRTAQQALSSMQGTSLRQ